MDVKVAMPWRAQPHRLRPKIAVEDFWAELGYEVVATDSHPGVPFNYSWACINAVEACDSEIVILCEADTIPEARAVEEALDDVDGRVTWLYDEYRVVEARYSGDDYRAAPAAELPEAERWRNGRNQNGACCVFRRETYRRIGGHDPRFRIGADLGFVIAAATLAGARRVPGLAIAFDHPTEDGLVRGGHARSMSLVDRYKAADGDPALVERILNEPSRGYYPQGVRRWKDRWPSPPPGRRFV